MIKYPLPFLVCQFFDKEGYYASISNDSRQQLVEAVSRKLTEAWSKNNGIVFCTLPFAGKWHSPGIPDVSVPEDWKAHL